MITSTSNAQVKYLVNLQKKAKTRREERKFVAEGIRMFLEIPAERLVKAYVTERFHEEHRDLFLGVNYELVTDSVFAQISDTKTPQGVLAVVSMRDYSMAEVCGALDAFVIACEDLQDPGNLGTILRAGEGAGITGIILSSNTVDLYNPKVIRATMGSLFRVPVVVVEDFCMAIRQMQNLGIKVLAAHLDGTEDYARVDYGEKCAFLIGNEGNGLTREAAAAADMLVKIPMKGAVESLNAAAAATVLMYDVAAKRRCR